jgi:hypothetical protein
MFSGFLNTGQWTKSITPIILNVIHYRQDRLESTSSALYLIRSANPLLLTGSIQLPQNAYMTNTSKLNLCCDSLGYLISLTYDVT